MEDPSAAERSSDATDRLVAHGLVERSGRYLLLRRREGRYLGGQWDVPGGTVEPGESPAAAAVRECWEEAGLRVRAGAEVSHHRNRDTEGRDLVFHTLTYALEETGPPVEVRLSARARRPPVGHAAGGGVAAPGVARRPDPRRPQRRTRGLSDRTRRDGSAQAGAEVPCQLASIGSTRAVRESGCAV